MPTQYVLAKGSLDLKKQSIEPFQFLTFKFSLYAVKEGIFSFAPEIIYMDEIGNRKICVPNPASIKISPVRQLNESPGERAVSINFANLPSGSQLGSAVEFEFKNETSKIVFEFLVGSFVEDYMRLRLPVEKSGWRTSMDAVKHGKVPFSAVYGRKGRSGRVISELQRRGLVETRFFPGERGRGGNIMKLRVCYEKEPVKRHIDLRVAKDKK
jgi:hypothetical protein